MKSPDGINCKASERSDFESPAMPPAGDGVRQALEKISRARYPTLANPAGCSKRASVALIVRVRPHPDHWPASAKEAAGSSDDDDDDDDANVNVLADFFHEDWVTHGDAEVLFIKRASRPGDRWTSHVALPGGKRDPEDTNDRATAVRETWEEVGLDVGHGSAALCVGGLPERVVTTSWGQVPLMVLCPFVFLLRRHDHPPLRIHGAEVSSAHWVPLRALLSPRLRTFYSCDVSDRLAKRGGYLARWFLRTLMGRMLFSAVRLVPSESVYDMFQPGVLPEEIATHRASFIQPCYEMIFGPQRSKPPSMADQPLLLWGLTLGILTDFALLLPDQDALGLWTYPTFTAPDVRIWLTWLSCSFRKSKHERVTQGVLEADDEGGPVAIEEGVDAVRSFKVESAPSNLEPDCMEDCNGGKAKGRNSQHSSMVGIMLDGYYDIVRKAVVAALLARLFLLFGSSLVMGYWIWRRRTSRGS